MDKVNKVSVLKHHNWTHLYICILQSRITSVLQFCIISWEAGAFSVHIFLKQVYMTLFNSGQITSFNYKVPINEGAMSIDYSCYWILYIVAGLSGFILTCVELASLFLIEVNIEPIMWIINIKLSL